MSIKLLAKVWTLQVSGTEREVLNVMCDHADDFGREARPSVAYIAWKVGCDARTVIRHIKKLRQKGALILERKARDHSPNVYRVNLTVYEPKPEFEAKGDEYHDNLRASRTDERGDILSQRGDKLVSPKPSLESNTHTSEPKTEKQECWEEVGALFPMMLNGSDWQKWNNAWLLHPDKRRHDYAKARALKANPRRFKFYLDDFMGYDPTKTPTWGDGAPAKTTSPPRNRQPQSGTSWDNLKPYG